VGEDRKIAGVAMAAWSGAADAKMRVSSYFAASHVKLRVDEVDPPSLPAKRSNPRLGQAELFDKPTISDESIACLCSK
jgi:hypothetical protein